jgi:hypothetical protein
VREILLVMVYILTGVYGGELPDAEDAKVTQRTQKKTKKKIPKRERSLLSNNLIR